MTTRFRGEFAGIEQQARSAFDAYAGGKDAADAEQKKAFALHVNAHYKELAPILFGMIIGKNYSPVIWKMIRPRGDEPTYKVEEE
jgi:hypothetical protein